MPYNHNRVHLEEEIDNIDYINASWIGKNEEMIATQGPKENTIQHFFQMILEQDIDVVVMLTKVFEEKKDGVLYFVIFTQNSGMHTVLPLIIPAL